MGTNIKRAINQYYDNSYDNIGAFNSYAWLVLFPAFTHRQDN